MYRDEDSPPHMTNRECGFARDNARSRTSPPTARSELIVTWRLDEFATIVEKHIDEALSGLSAISSIEYPSSAD